MQRRAAVLVMAMSLAMLFGCGTPCPHGAPGAGCAEKPPAGTAPSTPCTEPAAHAPTPTEPASPFTEEGLERFAARFVAALADRDCERFTLSVADIKLLFAPNIASIIEAGRSGWVGSLEGTLADSLLRYKSCAKGPDYSFTRIRAENAAREEVPQVTDLRIEITANGNPHTIIIRKMYGLSAEWKILKAEVFE